MAVPAKRDSIPVENDDNNKRHKPDNGINDKLSKFKKEPLAENIDYISLQSSLSLLRSRLFDIKKDIKELNALKQNIKSCEDVKAITKLISSNADYLNEISYKGAFIKCPEIDWKKDYGLDIDDIQSNNEDLTKINDNYEIIMK